MTPFIDWAMGYLREAEADKTAALSDTQLRNMVVFGCGRAIGYGLDSDSRLLLRFILLLLETGPALDSNLQARDILEDRAMRPETRLDTLAAEKELLNRLRAAGGVEEWRTLP